MKLFDQICFPMAQACMKKTDDIMRCSTSKNPPYYHVTLRQNKKSQCFEFILAEKRCGLVGGVSVLYHEAQYNHPAFLWIASETLNKLGIKPSTKLQLHPDANGKIRPESLIPMANSMVSLAIKDIERQKLRERLARPRSGLHP